MADTKISAATSTTPATTDLIPLERPGSAVARQATIAAIVQAQAASTSAKGAVELATAAEAKAGSSSSLAVTPAGLAYATWNVMYYGVVGDGVTDDTAKIQDAIDAANSGDTIYFPNGTYAISNTLQFDNDHYYQRIVGDGRSKIINLQAADFTGKPLIRLYGSSYHWFEGLHFYGNIYTSTPPHSLVALGRKDGSGGSNRFLNCQFEGNTTKALLYEIGSELLGCTDCFFYSLNNSPVYFTSGLDVDNIFQGNTDSNTCKYFTRCTMNNYSSAADKTGARCIVSSGLSQEVIFRDLYTYVVDGGTIVEWTSDASGSQKSGWVFDQGRAEFASGISGIAASTRFMRTSVGAYQLAFTRFNVAAEVNPVIEVTAGSVEDCEIDYLYTRYDDDNYIISFTGSGAAYFRHNILRYHGKPVVYMADAAMIAYNNIVSQVGGDTSDGDWLQGSGKWLVDYSTVQNIVIGAKNQDSQITYSRQRQHLGTFTDADTTPSILGVGLLYLNYSTPTTITNFDDGIDGQNLIIVAPGAGVITISHGTTIRLNGSADFAMGASATLNLVNLKGVWHEIGRKEP